MLQTFRLRKAAALQRHAGRSLRQQRPVILSCTPQPSTRIIFHALSSEERAKEDREAKIVGNPAHPSLNDHERLRLSHDRSGRSVCVGFFARHFHIAGSSRPAACREIQCSLHKAAALGAARAEASARGGPPQRRALRRLRPADANGSTPIRPTLLSESEPRIPSRDDDSRNSARKAETDLSGTAKSISNP